MHNCNTIEFLGIWEQLFNPCFNPLEFEGVMEFLGVWERVYNPNFNYGEFATIRNQSGLTIRGGTGTLIHAKELYQLTCLS